jgi:hypothetical protein
MRQVFTLRLKWSTRVDGLYTAFVQFKLHVLRCVCVCVCVRVCVLISDRSQNAHCEHGQKSLNLMQRAYVCKCMYLYDATIYDQIYRRLPRRYLHDMEISQQLPVTRSLQIGHHIFVSRSGIENLPEQTLPSFEM